MSALTLEDYRIITLQAHSIQSTISQLIQTDGPSPKEKEAIRDMIESAKTILVRLEGRRTP